jgi:mediator of RNA polymerase II transcription subunit 13
MISIGKGEAIIQVQPPALRFWEKLGLNPKAGKKDVSAIAIFEDDGEQGQGLVESWLSNVCSAYDVSIHWKSVDLELIDSPGRVNIMGL